jgi:hypothetical protein
VEGGSSGIHFTSSNTPARHIPAVDAAKYIVNIALLQSREGTRARPVTPFLQGLWLCV